MDKKSYKCYISEHSTKRYFWYILDNLPYLFGNEVSLGQPVKNIENIDKVANVRLIAITVKSIEIFAEHKFHIFGKRNTLYDIEG